MNSKIAWEVVDISNARYLGPLEILGAKEHHAFEVVQAGDKLVFGTACNTGLLQSGYLQLEEGETECHAIKELIEELETFFNDGPQFTNRIVCNERM